MDQLTVSERYKTAISTYKSLTSTTSTIRPDSLTHQRQLLSLLNEFTLISHIITDLSLFSTNESIEELSTNYIPFMNIWYYIADVSCRLFYKEGSDVDYGRYKKEYLEVAKSMAFQFLDVCNNYSILNDAQKSKYDVLEKGGNGYGVAGPMARREEKIVNYRLEKALTEKLSVLDSSDISGFDEEIVREVYLDQVRLFVLKAFALVESINMEIEVLKNRPSIETISERSDGREKKREKDDEFGYTTKLESQPKLSYQVSDLINKQGKILQPFTITSQKEKLREKVFGTGQVLPSMTVEEYLDYELANGKMLKEEVKQDSKYSDEEDSEDELEKRRWDDWKDENPKGAGNMKANIG
ncbi:Type 2A phosphatase-associated protein, putative (Tor signaling pathway regulator, putative) [Candida maltosa Xu316]|uniref:Type 2A phosphatase-associated protein, putative (Tor signaling pathway regulator, putative) n=1 Tax=Candida maltosa (strain Xu316) TaxID=1245528 RepID=M3IPD7_CANMX|nr:Type 2A phosphatase-associated protein, putative (Tor signaling pathway regulator, putative) [Candida maltosa Xu316]